MSITPSLRSSRPRRNVRLDTLLRLRWVSVIGQGTAVLVVRYGLNYAMPFWASLAVIALSAWLNIALRVRFQVTQRLDPDRAAWLLAFDIAELAVLLFLTGGLQNPFVFLFLGPVLISATALPPVYTMRLAGFAMACATVLAFAHYPLPYNPADPDPLELPALYLVAMWFSLLLGTASISVQAWQVTEESRQLADALAATELVMAREQHLSQLDGLAAAAAHELGTPLSTISLVSRELERAIEPDSPYLDDISLLREQSVRCRDILSKITELSSSGGPFDRQSLSAMIEEVAAPHRNLGVAIDVELCREGGTGAGRAAQSRHPLWPRQSLGECGRFRQQAGRNAGVLGRARAGGDDQRRRPGLFARNHRTDRRALCDHPAPPAWRGRHRRRRARPRLLHRQNPARALRRDAVVPEPAPPDHGAVVRIALAARGIRAIAGNGGFLRRTYVILIRYTQL